MIQLNRYKPVFKRHALVQAQKKQFSMEHMQDAFYHPERVYASKSYPGQYRVTGNKIVLCGVPDTKNEIFIIITVYNDRILTPPRPDQLDTPQGRLFAQRYIRLVYGGQGGRALAEKPSHSR